MLRTFYTLRVGRDEFNERKEKNCRMNEMEYLEKREKKYNKIIFF